MIIIPISYSECVRIFGIPVVTIHLSGGFKSNYGFRQITYGQMHVLRISSEHYNCVLITQKGLSILQTYIIEAARVVEAV